MSPRTIIHRLLSLATRRPTALIHDDPATDDTTMRITPTPSPRIRSPLSIALARVLDADCVSCRGFGCETCAYTGLH